MSPGRSLVLFQGAPSIPDRMKPLEDLLMNRKRDPLLLGSILAVLVLASCTGTEAPMLTSTPFLAPSATQERSGDATSTPPPPETGPAHIPTKNFSQMSQKWRVAIFVENPKQICVMNGDYSDRSCLDLNEDNFAQGHTVPGFLALSPDGAKVAYATECNIYIWTVGRDVFPLRTAGICGLFREVKWSPDGNSIACISEELQRTCLYCQAYFGDIIISSLDGTVHRVLTEELAGWSHLPDWSPDGKYIAFHLQRLKPNSPVDEEIFVIPAEGGSAVNLTNHSADDVRPQWSPDGSQIAFLSDRDEDKLMNLYLMNPRGGDLRKAVELRSPDHWPYSSAVFFWLPDGVHMIHDNRLINTISGQSELVELPINSHYEYGSWALSPQNEIGSPGPHLTPGLSTSEPTPCAANWSRLRPDVHAVVAGGSSDPPNRVRDAPDTDAKIIYQIYPGTIVRVLEGPVCANGLVFWKVENENIPGGVGWTAEGDMQKYFLEPVQ